MAKDVKAAGAAPQADKKMESKDKGKASGGKKGGEKVASSKKDHYNVKGGMLERKGRNCPKCGPGVFLAEHKDRSTCGKCGYTEFKTKK
jgi:small subunit ribosomal protein S27Ae